MNSVGQAFAVLKGHLSGDKKEAKKFLDSLSSGGLRTRNRMESRRRAIKKKHKMGY